MGKQVCGGNEAESDVYGGPVEKGSCVRAQCSVIQRQMYGAKTDAGGVRVFQCTFLFLKRLQSACSCHYRRHKTTWKGRW